MPVDKHPNGKPFTPSLSSNFRATKSPLTPRLAGSQPTTPLSAPRQTAFVRSRSPGKEDQQPSSFPGNITPRSAARKSRFGTESPSTTPTSSRNNVASPNAQSPPVQQGLGIVSPLARAGGGASLNEAVNRATTQSPLQGGPRRISGTQSMVNVQTEDTRFFRADDARPQPPSIQPKPTPDAGGQFFYVGGTSSISSPKLSPSRPTYPPPAEEKFFHPSNARSQVQANAPRPGLVSRNTVGPVLTTRSNQQNAAQRQFTRSPSPAKSVGQPSPPMRGQDTGPKTARPRSIVGPPADKRRGSVGSTLSQTKAIPLRHKKSMSTNSVSTTPTRKLSGPRSLIIPTVEQRLGGALNTNVKPADSLPVLPIPAISPIPTTPRSLSMGSQISERSLSNPRPTASYPEQSKDPLKRLSMTESPNHTIHFPISPPLPATTIPADPAVQARRERKVLDLEISNSSLLAINKTLERELRKQNVELRRFRRLSRSGRLSFAPTGRNISNSTLGTLPELDDESQLYSDSQASDSEDDVDELDDDVLSNDSNSITSPTLSSRARQRARDEKRLMLDLSKHRQMLLDSQKLSQSIRRCLMCTEDLIKEGSKALDYRPDVHVGGRVLNSYDEADARRGIESSDDNDAAAERDEGAKGLLSPAVEIGDWLQGGLWVSQGRSGAASSTEEEIVAGETGNEVERVPRTVMTNGVETM